MKKNPESVFVEEHATRQEHEEDAEGHQSRVEEPQPYQRGEISEMGEMWKEIQMLRQQLGSRAPAPKRGSPFSLAILEEGLPPNFRQSNVGEYDGHTDLEEHLGRFENAALLYQYSDEVSCRVFLGTFVRLAQQWFNTLQSNSIRTFEDFSSVFLHRFASSKKHQKNYLSLLVVKQQEAETLREFVQRFNNTSLEIPAATPDIMISFFTQGLRGGEFFKSLVKKLQSSYDDMLSRVEKYVNLEDAQRHKRMEQRPREVELREWKEETRKIRTGSRPRSRPSPRHGQGPPWINQRVGEQRGEGRGQDVPQEPVELRRGMDEDNHSTRGIIHMISGDATDEDSGRARKAHGRSFGSEDLRGVVTPHNDALVVTATIANYDVGRIFIDNRSSVNVLFKSTLDQMKLEGFEFEPVSTPLYGFAGHTIPPLGQIVLPLSLGTYPRRVTKILGFTVVDITSAYNGILGRPSLKDFTAVSSSYHQKLKFPVKKGVGVLCED
ncbi:uncharacterized protein [Primulina eburnea]|uniref:uncharacterized protein n=1 Tax=Primulina eburnea TaxID=1245227 RepID=UPI003C6C2B7B